jgi:uncharacterized protein
MKRHIILLLLFPVLLLGVFAHALNVPPLSGRVNDYARMLSPDMVRSLDTVLTDLERTDSTQIVVLTIPTLAGQNLEEFSIKVAEAWRIGRKGVDNGVILLVAKEERKIRIEVGRGLEGKLTDLVSGRIIRNDIAPRLKAGDMDGGIQAGVSALVAVVKGEYRVPSQAETARVGSTQHEFPWALAFIFLIPIGFLIVLAVRHARRRGRPLSDDKRSTGTGGFFVSGGSSSSSSDSGGSGFSGGGGDFGGGGASDGY